MTVQLESEGALEEACAKVSRDNNPAYVKDSELRYVAVNEAYAALWDVKSSCLIGQKSHQHFDSVEQNDRDEKERRTLVFGKDQVAHFAHPLKNQRYRIRIKRERRADQKPFIYGHFEPIAGVRFENGSSENENSAADDIANGFAKKVETSPKPTENQSELAIRGDYAYLKAAIELATVPIAVEDADGRIVAASGAFLENTEAVTTTNLPNGGKLRLVNPQYSQGNTQSLATVAKAVDGVKNRIEQVFDKANIGIVMYDPDEILVYGNPAIREFVGPTFDLTIGMSQREVVRSTWDEERCGMDCESWVEKGMAALHNYGVATTVPIGGGRWIRVINQLLEDGSILGIRLDVSDLMEREKALEAKETENELFRAVLDALPTPAFIKGPDFKYVYANQALAEVAQYRPEQMIGQTDFTLFGKQSKGIRDTDAKIMETGEACEFEFPMIRTDGKQIYLLSRKTRFISPEGQSYLLGSTTNITLLKNREAELVAARQKMEEFSAFLSTATSAMAQGLCIIENGIIQFSNEQLREQLDVASELLEPGRDWLDFFDFCFERGDYGWTDRKAALKEIVDCAVSGENYSVEHRKPDGRWVRVDSKSSGGGVTVMTTSDVTDARVREGDLAFLLEKAEDADRAKSEFLANMSHEIRTPMNGVLGMAELLSRTELDNRQKTFTDIIVKSGTALLTIINDILDFSKIDAGQMVLDTAPFDLRETIEDVATLVSARAVEKDVELIVRIHPELNSRVVGDSGRTRQILTNLVGNAVKFTEAGHVLIDLGGSEKDGKLEFHIRVEDTGVGIPKSKLKDVFEKFSQVDGSSTRRHEGTGLGLAITARLVELMGGKVDVESQMGEGSVFTVYLELPLDSRAPKQKPTSFDVSGSRVLVIDDNAVNRQILSEQLSAWGFDGCAASSGDEGRAVIEAVKSHGMKIDAVILDYHMPDENGAQVARSLRQSHTETELPIVMLTSMDIKTAEPNFADLGVQATLMKPARSSQLFDTLIQVLYNAAPKISQTENGKNPEPNGDAKEADHKPTGEQSSNGNVVQIAANAEPGAWIDEMHESHDLVVADIGKQSQEREFDILVAEDNEVNQIVFSQILEQMGVRYLLVDDGGKVFEAWQKHNPALILMDVSMPVMNGYQATGEIRRVESEQTDRARTPIIGVTAHALTGDRERCIEAGMDDYLSKPISPDKLEAKIRSWVKLDVLEDAEKTG